MHVLYPGRPMLPSVQRDILPVNTGIMVTKIFCSFVLVLFFFKPKLYICSTGSKFLYSSHAWTLISAVLEAVVKEPFEKHIIKMAKELGMDHTYLDENSPLIYHRGR